MQKKKRKNSCLRIIGFPKEEAERREFCRQNNFCRAVFDRRRREAAGSTDSRRIARTT